MERLESRQGRSIRGSLIVTGLILAVVLGGMAIAQPAARRKANKEKALLMLVEENEKKVVEALRKIETAQRKWRGEDVDGNGVSDYAADYALLYSFSRASRPVGLIDRGVAEASVDRSDGRPFAGYRFGNMTGGEMRGTYHPRTAYGVCARPAEPQETGRHTFILNTTGIYRKDRGDATSIVMTFPNVDDQAQGWKKVPKE